jgi:chemotaxis protein histidine kinase CheA
MDVVETTLQHLGGSIDVQTTPGAGTRFVMTIPTSASLVRCLLVDVAGEVYALPERQIAAVAEIARDAVDRAAGQPFYGWGGQAVPLHGLGRLLGLAAPQEDPEHQQAVIASSGTALIGLVVDRVLRFQDLFLKDLHPVLAMIPTVSGASVLGDGRPVLVLDAAALLRAAEPAR